MSKKRKKPHMRVVAGKIKGKLVECPDGGEDIRPMTSKVKEALFNILGNINGKTMLDLFTGSGNISIEAFSRGLIEADLVEMDYHKKEIIKKNLVNAGFEGGKLFISDALIFCRRCRKQYDLIMLDPPFKWPLKQEILQVISDRDLISDDGIVIMHLPKKEELPVEIGNLYRYDVRLYGVNKIMFYEKATK